MIVCSCRAVSDRALRSAAEAGRSLDEIVEETGVTTDCGCCAETVERIVSCTVPCRRGGSTGCTRAGPAGVELAA